MSFLAKLFINDEVRNLLDASQIFSKFADKNGRPTTNTTGKTLDFTVEATGNDTFFYENMFSPNLSCQGEIVLYKRDGLTPMFRIEFANAYVIRLNEEFSALSNNPLMLRISIAWGIIRMRDVIHEEHWNPNNPFTEIAATTIETEEEGELTDTYYEDKDGNKVDELVVGSTVYLVINTKNAAGKVMDIDLANNTKDFEYNGEILENDLLKNISVNGDSQKIKLKIIAQHH